MTKKKNPTEVGFFLDIRSFGHNARTHGKEYSIDNNFKQPLVYKQKFLN